MSIKKTAKASSTAAKEEEPKKEAVVEEETKADDGAVEKKEEKSMSLGDLLDEVLGINGAEDLLKFIRRIVGALICGPIWAHEIFRVSSSPKGCIAIMKYYKGLICLVYLWFLPKWELPFNLVIGFILLLIGLVAVATWTVDEAQRIEAEQKKAKEEEEEKAGESEPTAEKAEEKKEKSVRHVSQSIIECMEERCSRWRIRLYYGERTGTLVPVTTTVKSLWNPGTVEEFLSGLAGSAGKESVEIVEIEIRWFGIDRASSGLPEMDQPRIPSLDPRRISSMMLASRIVVISHLTEVNYSTGQQRSSKRPFRLLNRGIFGAENYPSQRSLPFKRHLFRHTATDCLVHPAAARPTAFWEVFCRRVASSAAILDERSSAIIARAIDEHWFKLENLCRYGRRAGTTNENKAIVTTGQKEEKTIQLSENMLKEYVDISLSVSLVFERIGQVLPEQLPNYKCGLSLVIMADVLSRRLVSSIGEGQQQQGGGGGAHRGVFAQMARHSHRLLGDVSLAESLAFIRSLARHGSADSKLCHRVAQKARAQINNLDTMEELRSVVDTFVLVDHRDADLFSAIAQRVSHVLGGDPGTDHEGNKIPTVSNAADVAQVVRGFRRLQIDNLLLVESVRDWSSNGVTSTTSVEDRKVFESCVGRV
ncbi:hypothetical protein FOL47_000588 [Perkinsus chesapeaki]|uniref:Uncharacterized protein n=1 Tax=Perkinsus chesapeaki TaxID=330153 RepID=A0A7J6MN80_PERCH|nr:hypothetical protein FOL47_000588 [Perkinsus chesapeaki]